MTRDGEEYEFDAIVPWGDYVFLFECKNGTLSGNNIVPAYYFALEQRSAVAKSGGWRTLCAPIPTSFWSAPG